MHRHYLMFRKQVDFLKHKIITCQITDCFTHRKDELVIKISNHEEYYLRTSISDRTPYLLLYPASRIKDSRVVLFPEIIGLTIRDISIEVADKIVYLNLVDLKMTFLFYGRTRNILLTDRDGVFQNSFKKQKESINIESLLSDSQYNLISHIDQLDKPTNMVQLETFIKDKWSIFNRMLISEISYRSRLQLDQNMSDLKPHQWAHFLEVIKEVMTEIYDQHVYIYQKPAEKSVVSVLKLRMYENSYHETAFDNPNDPWKKIISNTFQREKIDNTREIIRKKITQRLAYLEKTLKKIPDLESIENSKKQSEMIGHLLMTFAHSIKKGSRQVKLKNILQENEEYIVIKLNPKLNAIENAALYFDKYKNIQNKKKELNVKKDTLIHELDFWRGVYAKIDEIDTIKKAENLYNILVSKKLIQEKPRAQAKEIIDISSFHRLYFENEWLVLIGKNSRNNDILTFKFAHNYDWWFHAQGVPGSHVVLHLSDKNIQPPISVIKQVASVAAYHSNAKNSSSVPVNYTTVRYVRKPRKSAPGEVTISHENTIFVEPKKYL